jgi:hypothetical protein
MKTSELAGAALDWAVTKCEGYDHEVTSSEWGMWGWATDWAQGGPLIEREGIMLVRYTAIPVLNCGPYYWKANKTDGPTPLIAAMRCYVASKLGDTIEIPNELTGETA